MPEHARRAIASYEVDAEKFVTKNKFVDKRGAIMDYSKLSGDIPNGQLPPTPPPVGAYDWSTLSLEERVRLEGEVTALVERLRQRKLPVVIGGTGQGGNGFGNGHAT
jgi:hypothetical protein